MVVSSRRRMIADLPDIVMTDEVRLWSSQRKSGLRGCDEIVVVARSCDRLHGGRVDEAVPDEPIVDVNTDNLPEGDVGINLCAIDIAEPYRLQPSAFQRAR
jgi:hypothetical protein